MDKQQSRLGLYLMFLSEHVRIQPHLHRHHLKEPNSRRNSAWHQRTVHLYGTTDRMRQSFQLLDEHSRHRERTRNHITLIH